MKLLANNTVQAVLLIIALGFYGWSLAKDLTTLKLGPENEAIAARENLGIVYAQPSGVSVYGKQIIRSSLGTKKSLVFLLRSESLQNDLSYWGRVGMLLDSHKEIGLAGYCDSQQCAESIRKMQPLAFPVLEFGEATSIQAVVNADAGGNAILKDVGTYLQSNILWRAAESSPQEAAQEAIR